MSSLVLRVRIPPSPLQFFLPHESNPFSEGCPFVISLFQVLLPPYLYKTAIIAISSQHTKQFVEGISPWLCKSVELIIAAIIPE
jgi:hypothetical protein